jgi:hypothetical protein
MALQQAFGHPRVLAGDQIDATEQIDGAQGDVAEIADRRRHQIEAGRRRFTSRRRLGRLGRLIARRPGVSRPCRRFRSVARRSFGHGPAEWARRSLR